MKSEKIHDTSVAGNTHDDDRQLVLPNVQYDVEGAAAEAGDGDDEVVDATTLEDTESRTEARGIAMRRRWFDEQPTLVRFVSTLLVPAKIHYFVSTGGSGGTKLTLHCNGASCVLCLAKHKAVPTFLMPLYFVDDAEVAAIDFSQTGGAGSLRGAIIPLLKRPSPTDLIVEICKQKGRHTVVVVTTIDQVNREAADYGDAVLRDLVARGGVRAKDIRAVVEQRDNQMLLSDLEWLPAKVRLYHPGLDIAKL